MLLSLLGPIPIGISVRSASSRNFATCYSLGSGNPVFSRYSPLLIDDRLLIPQNEFDVYVRARILSTRGYGEPLSSSDITSAIESAHSVVSWMDELADGYLSPELRYERV